MDLSNTTNAELQDLARCIATEMNRRASLDTVRDTISKHVTSYGHQDLNSILTTFITEDPVTPEEPEEPEDPPVASPDFAFTAHSPNAKASYWNSIIDREWADGAFIYYPGPWGKSALEWDSYWEAAVAAHPEGLHTVVSPKVLDEAKLEQFCRNLPQAWREKMIYAYYQEPEDNHTTEAQIADFRAKVKRAGEIVRPYGIRNAVELQEWSLDPNNKTYPSGNANTARFVDPADVDHISWSIYEKNLKNRSAVMIGRITEFMNLFPKLTWDMSATGVAVPVGTPAGDPKRAARAAIVADFLAYAKADPRCIGFGWFDFPAWVGTLDYGVDPELETVFQNFRTTLKQ